MTPTEWKALPELVRRQRLIEVGLRPDTIAAVTQVVAAGAEVATLPPRTIGAIRLNAQPGRRTKLLYFRSTVTPLLTKEYQ
jgi:hypothetical protein